MTNRGRPVIGLLMDRARIEANGCWVWTGALSSGYGSICIDYKETLAHRASYEAHVGPIPKGLQLDHLCRNRACINPAHLEPVTSRENTLRGVGPSALNAAKTHCVNGHPFSDEVRTERSGATRRECMECKRIRGVERYAAIKLARPAREKSTHCMRGHPFSGDNLRVYLHKGQARRHCVACQAERDRERAQASERPANPDF